MSAPWWRIGLLVVLLTGANLTAVLRDRAAVDPVIRIQTLAADRGWRPVGSMPLPEDALRHLLFRVPQCMGNIEVTPFSLNFEQQDILEATEGFATGRHVYVYVESKWDRPDLSHLIAARIYYSLMRALRLSQYSASDSALLIIEPARCRVIESVDWRKVCS